MTSTFQTSSTGVIFPFNVTCFCFNMAHHTGRSQSWRLLQDSFRCRKYAFSNQEYGAAVGILCSAANDAWSFPIWFFFFLLLTMAIPHARIFAWVFFAVKRPSWALRADSDGVSYDLYLCWSGYSCGWPHIFILHIKVFKLGRFPRL